MADHYYSVVLGDESPDEVTVGTSTSGEIIELRVHDGDGTTKTDLVKALEAIRNYVIQDDEPA